MERWYKTLDSLFARVWDELHRGADSETAAAHLPVMATIGLDGGPQVRTVVLREARRDEGVAVVHTDNQSEKVRELERLSHAAMHVWDPKLRLQTRMRGRMFVETGAATAWLWDLVPDGSRSSYGVTPTPGTPIETADGYVRASDPSRFAVLSLRVDEIDAVHLSGDHHRRARFRRDADWRGEWLAP